jgi:RNA polymerase sigma-70 factor (ECF subfamily)
MSPMPSLELAALLEEARKGSREALGELLKVCRPRLLDAAERDLPADLQAKGSASDLVQESLAEAVQDFPEFAGRTEGELLAWLRRILHHNLLTFISSYRQTGKRNVRLEMPLDGPESGDLPGHLLSNSTSPSGKAMRREQAEAMEQALERLSEDDRQVIVLHHQEDRPFPEVARLMGRSEMAVRQLWTRAIRRWRQEVEARHGRA